MEKVTISKNELLQRVKANLETHIQDHSEAREAWRQQCIEFHENRIHQIEDNISVTHLEKQEPSEPASHEESYILVIEMLEMSVDDNVSLTGKEFRQYVQDEWMWASEFRNTVTSYTGKQFT